MCFNKCCKMSLKLQNISLKLNSYIVLIYQKQYDVYLNNQIMCFNNWRFNKIKVSIKLCILLLLIKYIILNRMYNEWLRKQWSLIVKYERPNYIS